MGFGSLRCLGTQVHLKNKFGDGFKLTLNCESEGQDVSALLAEVCEGARLVHALGRQQTFVLPVQNVDVAHLFNTLERQKLRRCALRDRPRQPSLPKLLITPIFPEIFHFFPFSPGLLAMFPGFLASRRRKWAKNGEKWVKNG